MSLIPLFSQIARESHKKVAALQSRINKAVTRKKIPISEDEIYLFETKIRNLELERDKHSLIAIIFSAIAIEAYIYDYAARHLTDAYVRDHIDKLDTISKWVVVPRLITGREMPRRQKWFGLLKGLIKTRNSLVHHKSSQVPGATREAKRFMDKLRANETITTETAKRAPQLLDLLILEMTALDPEESFWIKSYLA
jgi:hypothetical protein